MVTLKKELKYDLTDRRKASRLNIPLKIEYKLLPKQNILKETSLEDVSGTGLRVNLDYYLNRGSRLKTLLYFPEQENPVTAFSEVVWCKKRPADKEKLFDVGMKYIKVDQKDKERFVFLFCEAMINYFISGQPIILGDNSQRIRPYQ